METIQSPSSSDGVKRRSMSTIHHPTIGKSILVVSSSQQQEEGGTKKRRRILDPRQQQQQFHEEREATIITDHHQSNNTSRTTTTTTPYQRHVRWGNDVDNNADDTNDDQQQQQQHRPCNDDGIQKTFRILDDPATLFHDYTENDIWYKREDYAGFMIERVRTVERIRALAAIKEATSSSNTINNDDDIDDQDDDYCMRGLEPFQDDASHDSLHSKRNLHKSTVIMEQCRQVMFGQNDPDRFRRLLQSQSTLAQFRAVQLAAIDQYEVYPDRPLSPSQRSLLLTGPSNVQQQDQPTKTDHAQSLSSPSELQSAAATAAAEVMMRRRRFSMPNVRSTTIPSTSIPGAFADLVGRVGSHSPSISPTGGLLASSSALLPTGSISSGTTDTSKYAIHQNQIRPSHSYQSLSTLLEEDKDNNNNEISKTTAISSREGVANSTSTEQIGTNTTFVSASSSVPKVISPVLTGDGRPVTSTTTGTKNMDAANNDLPDLSSPDLIREFQEKNARRLMEIYKPHPMSATTSVSTTSHHQSLFRFSLRRDSLSSTGRSSMHVRQQQQQSLASAMMASSRFPIRRDSLSHVQSR